MGHGSVTEDVLNPQKYESGPEAKSRVDGEEQDHDHITETYQ